jgi:hypothetical protein
VISSNRGPPFHPLLFWNFICIRKSFSTNFFVSTTTDGNRNSKQKLNFELKQFQTKTVKRKDRKQNQNYEKIMNRNSVWNIALVREKPRLLRNISSQRLSVSDYSPNETFWGRSAWGKDRADRSPAPHVKPRHQWYHPRAGDVSGDPPRGAWRIGLDGSQTKTFGKQWPPLAIRPERRFSCFAPCLRPAENQVRRSTAAAARPSFFVQQGERVSVT